MVRLVHRSILAPAILGLTLALGLAGCSDAPIGERLPTEMGGLPKGAPARPATTGQYPAVHDMPPPRSTDPMTDDEQLKLEKELQAARDRQEALQADDDPAKKAAPAKDKKPATAKKKPPGDAKPLDVKPKSSEAKPSGVTTTGAKTTGGTANP